MNKQTTAAIHNLDNRYRAFSARYLGPTNTRGSRLKIDDLRCGTSITVDWDDHISRGADEQAARVLEERGIQIAGIVLCDSPSRPARLGHVLLLTRDFGTPLAPHNTRKGASYAVVI